MPFQPYHSVECYGCISDYMTNIRISKQLEQYFISHSETIAVAESVTSGLLQSALSDIPQAEQFYQGGITVYNLGQKYKHLDVEPIHAAQFNSVSPRVAEQMAINVCKLFNADWGIGVTGYASPVPDANNKLFCYYAIYYKNHVSATGEIKSKIALPQKVREYYSAEIINVLLKLTKHGQNG